MIFLLNGGMRIKNMRSQKSNWANINDERDILGIIYPLSMQNIDHNNYEESSRKIKTPSCLFLKSSAKSPSSRRQYLASPSIPQQDQISHQCATHTNKAASYFTVSEKEEIYFCEKCAITLASQGHSIQKIKTLGNSMISPSLGHSTSRRLSFDPRRQRQSQISKFLQELQSVRETVSQTNSSITEQLIQSEQFYGGQLEQINDYFNLIMRSLELQKHKCYNHILLERQQAQQHIRNVGQSLNTLDHEVTRILMDIEQNLETVYTINEQMYRSVLSHYNQQREKFQKCIDGLQFAPVQLRRIQFEGVPESIHNLSQVVIQSSLTNKQGKNFVGNSFDAEDFSQIQALSPRQIYNSSQAGNSLKFSFEAARLREDYQDDQISLGA